MLIRHGLGSLSASAGRFRRSAGGRHHSRGHVVGMAVTALLLGLMPVGGVAYASPAQPPAVTVAWGSPPAGRVGGCSSTVTDFTSSELVVVVSCPLMVAC